MTERHLAILPLYSPHALLGLAQQGAVVRLSVGEDCPKDAAIVGSYYDGPSDAFHLVMSHPSFDNVPEGCRLMHLCPLTAEIA